MKRVLIALLLGLGAIHITATDGKAAAPFTDTFVIDKSDLSATGQNRYFVLEPGYQLVRYQQEVAPKVALDRAEIISVTETLATPACHGVP